MGPDVEQPHFKAEEETLCSKSLREYENALRAEMQEHAMLRARAEIPL